MAAGFVVIVHRHVRRAFRQVKRAGASCRHERSVVHDGRGRLHVRAELLLNAGARLVVQMLRAESKVLRWRVLLLLLSVRVAVEKLLVCRRLLLLVNLLCCDRGTLLRSNGLRRSCMCRCERLLLLVLPCRVREESTKVKAARRRARRRVRTVRGRSVKRGSGDSRSRSRREGSSGRCRRSRGAQVVKTRGRRVRHGRCRVRADRRTRAGGSGAQRGGEVGEPEAAMLLPGPRRCEGAMNAGIEASCCCCCTMADWRYSPAASR